MEYSHKELRQEMIDVCLESLHEGLFTGTSGNLSVALGDGTNDLCHFLDVLKESGYNGFASLEICPNQYFIDPTAACRKSLAWLSSHGYLD